MSYVVRLATRDDVPELEVLIPVSVRALCAGAYTERQIDGALGTVFGVDSQLIADGTFYVAVADDEVVGCGGWSKRQTLYGGDALKREADPLLDPTRDAARIRAFFVHPDWARRGIGRRLIAACETAALEAGFRRMELGATIPGEPLYAAMGYTVTERIAVPLPGGEHLPAARMMKLLGVEPAQAGGEPN